MRKFTCWMLAMAFVALATHVATVRFGTIPLPWGNHEEESAEDDDEIVIIAAVKKEKAGSHVNEAWLRKKVFGKDRAMMWPYVQEGELLGYKGCIFSAQPLEKRPLLMLPLW